MPNRIALRCVLLTVHSFALIASGVDAQSTNPQPLPMPASIPAPQDEPYPGVIRVHVDATDVDRHIFQVHETIPVRGGEPLVLLYPEWLPGKHADYGRAENLAGLMVYANGERVNWVRDPLDAFAFHIAVPAEATTIELSYQFLSAVDAAQGRIVMTPEMLNLQWQSIVLYPAGHYSRQIMFEPSVQVPVGWQIATALQTELSGGDGTSFKQVALDTLVDSPIFAGKYFKRLDLNPGSKAPVYLNIVADREDSLEITPEQLEMHRALIQQADKLYGSHHYDSYNFLFALTDRLGGIGIEHHQSSENTRTPSYFTEWEKELGGHSLLGHEYTHSWNGKFRQPADLWIPNYSVPMRGSLLWVYEGQTQYWGKVLSTRAGLLTQQQSLDALAWLAAAYDHRVGREWRSLQDTTSDPVIAKRRAMPWRSWARREDYYSEGMLIWLDADTLIRELSGNKKSLNDFAREFFGVNNGSFVPVTYVFEDVVEALNSVQPYDWNTFLRSRVDGHGPAPLDGIDRGGYTLVYTDTPTEYFADSEVSSKKTDLTFSIGVVIAAEGALSDVLWEGPAFKAGLTVGNQIIAVNGIVFDASDLKFAIQDSVNSGAAIELLIKDGERYRTVPIEYDGGLRYPHLERKASGPAFLDAILTPIE